MSSYRLSAHAHRSREDGMCAMEWAAYLAGEPHSDHPVCVSPMLQEFCVELNDALPDDQRQRMRPYLARTIGTAGDGLDVKRQWMCADWMIREYAPAWLELIPACRGDAESLRALPPILAFGNVQQEILDRAKWNAGGPVSGAAVEAAARDAVAASGGDSAWVAVGPAVGNAVRAAAWTAAWRAAWTAARTDALAPTVLRLQNSILAPGGLLDRMLPLEPVTLPAVTREVVA